jgi:hypothetical protein
MINFSVVLRSFIFSLPSGDDGRYLSRILKNMYLAEPAEATEIH